MADSNIGLKISLAGQKEYNESIKQVKLGMQLLKSEMALATSGFSKTDKSVEALSARNNALSETISKQKNMVLLLKEAFQKSAKELGENDKITLDLATKLNKAKTELNGMERELRINEKALKEAGGEVENLGNEMDETGKKASNFGDVLKASLVSEVIIGGIKAIGDAVIETSKKINDSINIYASFEDSMLQVAATMGMTSDEISSGSDSYKLLEKAAKDAGINTVFSASNAADALNYLALAGYDAEKAAATLPKVLNLAAAGGMELATTSDLVTDAMSALKLETSEIDVFMDKLAKTAQSSNTSVQQLGEAILVSAGTATSTGQDLTVLNTSLGILADNGIKGSESGTKLRNILLSLSSPTDKAAASLNKLGISVYDEIGNMRNLNDIMGDLGSSLYELTQEERVNSLNDIFNKTDINAINFLLEGSNERYKELSELIDNSAGAAQIMAETMESGLAGTERAFDSAVEGMKIEIGSLFGVMKQGFLSDATDILRTFTGNLQDAEGDWSKIGESIGILLTDFINMLSEQLPKIIDIGIQVISMLGEALINNLPTLIDTAVEIVKSLLNGIIKVLPDLTRGALKLILALVDGIIQNLPQIAKAAIEIVVELAKGIADALPQLIPSVIEVIVTVVEILLENLPLIIEAALQLVTGLAEGIIEALPVLIKALPKIIKGITDFLIQSVPLIVDTGILLLTSLVDALPEIIDGIVSVLPEIVTSLAESIVTLQFKLTEAGIKLFVALAGNLPTIISELNKASTEIVNAILSEILLKIPDFASAGLDLIKGLWEGIKDSGPWLIDKILGFFGGMVRDILDFLDIKSPSRLFRDQIGKNMALGVGVGFVDEMNRVSGEMKKAIPTNFDVNTKINGGFDLSSFSMSAAKSSIIGGSSMPDSIYSGGALGGMNSSIDSLVLVTNGMFGLMKEMAGKMGYSIYLDKDTLVGKLAPGMDSALGNMSLMRAR